MPAGLMRGHALVALHLEGRCVRLDPTHDARTAERLNCELVTFSKNEDRFLPERTKDGRPLVEIVEPDLGIYAGVPAWIVDATVNGEWQRRYDDWCAMLDEVRSVLQGSDGGRAAEVPSRDRAEST